MNEHPLKKTLRHIAEEEFPPGTDLWPEIQQGMERANPKRNEMAIRFSNFTRAVAFGAMLVLLTLGLAWVLSNTYAQPAKGTAENTPSSELPELVATSTPVPTVTLIPTKTETAVSFTLTPSGTPMLSMDSDSDTIQQFLNYSESKWTSIFVDALTTRIDGDTTTRQRTQIWYVDPDKSREIYDLDDDNLADTMVFTQNILQTIFDLKTGQETTQILESINYRPYLSIGDPRHVSILDPGGSIAFTNEMLTSSGTFRPLEHTIIASRETLIVEWSDDTGIPKDRLYIDVYTGVVLKWENLRKGYRGINSDGEEYLMDASVEVLEITYDATFPDELFYPAISGEPEYMDYPPIVGMPVFIPTPGNPDTSLQYGEIYLLSQGDQTRMLHFPASCLITGQTCPQPEFIWGLPGGTAYFPFVWSQDSTQMLYGSSYSTAMTWVFDRSSQNWTQFVEALFSPVWSPDGQWIIGAKARNVDAASNSLFVVSANGTMWQEIMADQPGIKYPLAWLDENNILVQNSLDSEKSVEDGALYDELQVYDLLSGKVIIVAEIPRDGNEVTMTLPSLSPDRSKIAYTLDRIADGTSTVVIIDFIRDQETSFEYTSGIVSWSPDGKSLIHNSTKDGPCTLTQISLDGKDAKTLFDGDYKGICSFVWSPDGQYLLVPTLAKIGTVPRLFIVSMLTGETRLIELPDVGVEFWWPVASWVP